MQITGRLVLPTLTRKFKLWIATLAATALLLVPLAALASDVFGDVPGTLPQHDAINRVYAAGIMRACTAGTPPNFCPDDYIRRAQQAAQWDRALGLNGTPAPGTYVFRAQVADNATAFIARFGSLDSGSSNSGASCSSRLIAEVFLFAGTFPPAGTAFAHGQLLPINQNQALFSLIGTKYGGNGQTSFALPDMRGLEPTGVNYVICLGGVYPSY
jgi:hypothetical protein